MLMSKAVENSAHNTPGKKVLTIEAFARALQQLPTILADYAGFDSTELVSKHRAAIHNGISSSRLDLYHPGGRISDMRELGVVIYSMRWMTRFETDCNTWGVLLVLFFF